MESTKKNSWLKKNFWIRTRYFYRQAHKSRRCRGRFLRGEPSTKSWLCVVHSEWNLFSIFGNGTQKDSEEDDLLTRPYQVQCWLFCTIWSECMGHKPACRYGCKLIKKGIRVMFYLVQLSIFKDAKMHQSSIWTYLHVIGTESWYASSETPVVAQHLVPQKPLLHSLLFLCSINTDVLLLFCLLSALHHGVFFRY